MKTHQIDVRVYYEDTDFGGVVYYANYLKFAERGRTEFLRYFGLENTRLRDEHGLLFVVRRCEVDFLQGAKLDDCLQVTTELLEITGARMVMKQSILRHDSVLASMLVTVACVSGQGKVLRIPKPVLELLK